VVGRHSLSQVPVEVLGASCADPGEGDRFDEDVRGDQHDAGHGPGACVDERDRRAIRVADEDRSLGIQLTEHLRQDVERFVGEERCGA